MALKVPDLMHATEMGRPFHTKGWVYEEKYDGWRMLAVKDANRVRLVSRRDRDHTRRFQEIAAAVASLKPETLILDGEIAVFDEDLVSRFEWLGHLHHEGVGTPPIYIAFDLLKLGEKDYRSEPLRVRRRALEKEIRGQRLILPARRLLSNGLAAWAEVLHRGIEGYVAKDPDSTYTGGRSLKWIKVKVPKYREKERGWYDSERSE